MNVVFVHLNSTIPRYLHNNLLSCAKKFPTHKIHLIHNLSMVSTIPGVNLFQTKVLNSLESTSEILNHPKDFRNNFWFSSIARLMVFPEFMKSNPGPLLHVESDVILSEDFPLDDFMYLDEAIAYPIVFKERAVASTVFIRDEMQAQELANFVNNEIELNRDTTDMLTLRRYFDSFPKKVFPLPFFHSFDPDFICEIDPLLKSRLTECQSRFTGIFDGSDLGVYYFGTDPRNMRGLSILRKEILFTNLRLLQWNLLLQSDRAFPYALFGNQRIPIYSLHVTSKRSDIFMVEKERQIISKFLKNQHARMTKKIYLRVLYKQIILSVGRRLNTILHK